MTSRISRRVRSGSRPLVAFISRPGRSRTTLALSIATALLGAASASAAPAVNPNIAAKQAEAQRILGEVQTLDATVERAAEGYNLATIRLQSLEKDLATNTKELRVTQSNLSKAEAYLKRRLRDLYTSDQKGNSGLEVLLGSSSLDDVINRLDTQDRVSAEDSRILGEVITFRAQVSKQRVVLRTARASQAKVVAERAARKHWIEGQLVERKRLLSSIRDEVAKLQAQEAAHQAALRRQLQARLATQRREQAARLSDTVVGATADTPDGSAVAPPSPYTGAVGVAMRYLGVPYLWAGSSPSGFDCSGFTSYVFAQLGVSLPHNAAAQFSYGTPVSRDQLQPGDLVFFEGLGHVGIYVGGGQFIHAPHTGDVVKISNLDDGYYTANWVGARRIT